MNTGEYIQIHHLTQVHPMGGFDGEDSHDKSRWNLLTAKSQYKILKYFWDKPDSIVFVEGHFGDLADEEIRIIA